MELQALPKTAEVQAITFHPVNRNIVQTEISVRSVCESIHGGPQGEGNFLWKPQQAFFTSKKVAEDISGESKSAFLPSSSRHEDLGFQAVRTVSAASPLSRPARVSDWEENCCIWKQDRHVVAIRTETWCTRWGWPQTDLGQRVFANTFMVGLCAGSLRCHWEYDEGKHFETWVFESEGQNKVWWRLGRHVKRAKLEGLHSKTGWESKRHIVYTFRFRLHISPLFSKTLQILGGADPDCSNAWRGFSLDLEKNNFKPRSPLCSGAFDGVTLSSLAVMKLWDSC